MSDSHIYTFISAHTEIYACVYNLEYDQKWVIERECHGYVIAITAS